MSLAIHTTERAFQDAVVELAQLEGYRAEGEAVSTGWVVG